MKINILILASGKGSRFKEYTDVPKPLINVKGEPMYKHVLKNLNIENPYEVHAVFQEDVAPSDSDLIIHKLNQYTDGAASSAYSIISEIHKNEPWLIMDCDLIVNTEKILFGPYSSVIVEKEHTNDPRASYSLIRNNEILCTAEKQVISPNRNVGMYYWSSSILFCECYEEALIDQATVNNEYYISPLYNYAIRKGEKVVPYYAHNFTPIGTPEDLKKYETGSINNRIA